MSRARPQWSAHQKPRCFASIEEWQEWFAVRAGSFGPCQDCTPEYRCQMLSANKCERPEVVFARDTETGEVEGIVAEDPRYARLLMGLPMGRHLQVVGRTVEPTEAWRKLLAFIKGRAHRDTQRAIWIWLKRAERADK